jgi:Leucine-rich repeat (LRR) protein
LEIDENLEDRDYLNAYKNVFSELEANTFVNIPNLVVIDLQNNQIKEISEEAFTGSSQLTLLDLGTNFIEKLKVGTFDPLTALKTLGLEKNKIKVLMEGIFDKNLNLDQIDLDHNEIFAVGPTVLKPGREWKLKGNKCADESFKINDTNLVQRTQKCVENYREKFSEKCNLETI